MVIHPTFFIFLLVSSLGLAAANDVEVFNKTRAGLTELGLNLSDVQVRVDPSALLDYRLHLSSKTGPELSHAMTVRSKVDSASGGLTQVIIDMASEYSYREGLIHALAYQNVMKKRSFTNELARERAIAIEIIRIAAEAERTSQEKIKSRESKALRGGKDEAEIQKQLGELIEKGLEREHLHLMQLQTASWLMNLEELAADKDIEEGEQRDIKTGNLVAIPLLSEFDVTLSKDAISQHQYRNLRDPSQRLVIKRLAAPEATPPKMTNEFPSHETFPSPPRMRFPSRIDR